MSQSQKIYSALFHLYKVSGVLNSERRKVEWRWPGVRAKGGQGVLVHWGQSYSFVRLKRVLEMGGALLAHY